MSPSVSVVVPSFNRVDLTLRAVASALAQSYPCQEVIVVDDGSAPALDPECFAALSGSVRVLRRPVNGGAAAARQAGIDAASGEVVAFLDSDDAWLPGKLAGQVALYRRLGDDRVAISCGWREVMADGREGKTRVPIPGETLDQFASGCWFCPGTTLLVARRMLDRVGPFSPTLRRLEDLDWSLRFALAGGRLAVVPETLASVAVGRRARLATVDAAADQILADFRERLGQRDQRLLSRLEAYLALERAVAARNDGQPGRMTLELARSFVARPRLSFHLERWWSGTR